MPIIKASLLQAFEQPGCPLCRLGHEMEQRYLRTLLDEYVNDLDLRRRLLHDQGLCPAHAWALQGMEYRYWQDGLKTAILYESLGEEIGRSLARHSKSVGASVAKAASIMEQPAQGRGLLEHGGRLGRWFVRHFSPTGSAKSRGDRSSPTTRCFLCEVAERREAMRLSTLVCELADPAFLRRFSASDGLCLPHLRQALQDASDEQAEDALIRLAQDRLATLMANLRAYTNKHRWQQHPELRSPWEEASWIRMVAFFAGEATEQDEAEIGRLRRQALDDYDRRPR